MWDVASNPPPLQSSRHFLETAFLVAWSLREDIQKKNCRFGENGTIGGEGVRKIIEFSSFTNDEKQGRGGLRVTFHYLIEPNYD